MINRSNDITAWVAEIHIHSSNLKSIPTLEIDRSISKDDYHVFRFTSLEIARFYELYRRAHKWKRTVVTVNDERVVPSGKVTQVFRCCYDAGGWPRAQNEWRHKTGRPVKALEQEHFCYGYDRTIHSIVGCQQIKVARDTSNGWMNRQFVKVKNDIFAIDLERLEKRIIEELHSGPQYCPFMVSQRISYGLEVVEQLIKGLQDFWTIEKGSLQPRPFEYYFDMKYDDTMGSRSIVRCSLVFYRLIATILGLSLYETVMHIAVEHPALGLSIGIGDFRENRTYVKFERLKELESEDVQRQLPGR